jgi:predicted DNA binding CopG/RHH family protein
MTDLEFDKKFDNGEDITSYLDLKNISRPNLQQKRVNIDFPVWMVEKIDKQASRIGITRQSLIKLWLADRLAH